MTAPLWSDDAILNGKHILSQDGFCWCQPRIEDVLPFGHVVVHRHFMDRPEYTGEETEHSEEAATTDEPIQ